MKNEKLIIIVSVITTLLLFSVQSNAFAQDTIKIGVLSSSLPGGVGIKNAAILAADEINDIGGISGRKIELFHADSKGMPAVGAYEYTRLVTKEKVIAVIGTSSSEEAITVMEQMAEYKVPYLVTGAVTPKITERVRADYDNKKYLFKIYLSSSEIAEFSTEWIIRTLIMQQNLKKIALLIEGAVWTRPLSKLWEKKFLQAGAEITAFEYFDYNTKDFDTILSKIIETGPEAICVASSKVDPAYYVKPWAEKKGPLMFGLIARITTLWNSLEDKSISVGSFGFPGVAGITVKGGLFYEKYLQKFKKRPEYTSPCTYDAFFMLKEALEKSNSTKPELLVKSLEETDFDGVMSRWVFDKKSHNSKFEPGYRNFMMIQWHPSGKLCILSPKEMKNCDLIYPPWDNKSKQVN